MGLKGVLVPLASVAVLLCAAAGLRAEEPGVSTDPTTDPTAAPRPIADLDRLPAHGAVREGNRLLLEGDAASALEAYEHARNLRPDALEVPFVEGLAHYAQKEYVSARDAFEKAALSEDRSLSDDALYSIGTTYHAEAFESLQDPEVAIEKLESAMQRYRAVLANQPDHKYARDANLKAASVRRRLKKMLEQQQQRQSQQQNENSDQGDEDQEDRQRQDQGDRKQDEQQDEEQRNGSEEQQNQQDAQPDSSDQDREQQAQDSQEDQEERASREQAERRLREMMQALREREKQRRRHLRKIPIAPVDKDW